MPIEDLSDTEALIKELISWGEGNQACLNVKIYQDPKTGLSFKAAEGLSPQSKIVACPYSISLSYLNAVDIGISGFHRHGAPFPQKFLDTLSQDNPNIIGHFFLIQQYLLHGSSFWWPYIRVLPQPSEPQKLGIPIWWPQEDQEFLNGTNAEPPIVTRRNLWVSDWERGTSAFVESGFDSTEYSYELYQWAATIFGTRSFRASLTIPEDVLHDMREDVREHVKKDRFSLLFPILDVGNHNGINNVDWRPDANAGLCLHSRNAVTRGSQVFNFYGNKSNSELLVGYGFTLPRDSSTGFDNDVVNLKLKPSPDALLLRRNQPCHVVPSVPDEEFMFAIRRHKPFSHDLVDLVLCMVANNRERKYLSRSKSCPGRDPGLFHGPLCRAATQVLFILYGKLEHEITRIKETSRNLKLPSTYNQKLAVDYRKNQLEVLDSALLNVSTRMAPSKCSGLLCQHIKNTTKPATELFSLECAFEWLRLDYADIYDSVVQIISDDQEEPLPLNWVVLVEDWDHTYWVIWIFILRIIWDRDGENKKFPQEHKDLGFWMGEMKQVYDEETQSTSEASNIFYAEDDEGETIDNTIAGILPHLVEVQQTLLETTRLRNFASLVAHEEVLPMKYSMHDGQIVEQNVLCIAVDSGIPDMIV